MSKAEFAIAYDGPALANHTMDVQALGPALLAIGDMCREAHRVINGDDGAEVKVHVKATSEGCFNVVLELIQAYNAVADLVRDEDVSAAKDIIEWLGLAAVPGSLLAYLKWKKGRKPISQEPAKSTEGDPQYNITVAGGGNNVTVISGKVQKLVTDPRVRAAQRRTLAPLNDDGIEEFQVRQDGRTVFSVNKDEVRKGYYDISPEEVGQEENINEPQTFEAILRLRSPVFEQDRKWQFYYGEQRISATLRDMGYVNRVFVSGERFGVGDIFRVRLCLTQVLLPNGKIRNDYEITKVIETTEGPKQLDLGVTQARLFDEDEDDDD